MTTTPHGQVPEALIDLIDAYAETRHRCGRTHNARTEAARNAVIEALSGVQALSAAPVVVADAMADSHYLAGVSAGWNAANADDPNAALQKLHESRAGYLQPIRAAARALALSTPPAEQQAEPGAVPQRWKAVPVNPTPEMWKAAKTVPDPNPPYPPHYGLVWDAMLAASPTPPAQQAAPKAAPGELSADSLRHQNKLLAETLGACILASGIVRKDIDGFTGPELLHFGEDLRSMLEVAPKQEVQEPTQEMVDAVMSLVDLEVSDPEDHRYDDGSKLAAQICRAVLALAPRQEAQEPGEIPESIERMATDRYKVVPSHESMFHRWAVVAGSGTQQLYLGSEVECQNMARKFAGAFLDGAFVTMQSTSPNSAAQLSDDVVKDAAFEAVRKKLCTLPRYSFVLDDDGLVRRAPDRTGNWIEFDEAHALFDPVSVEAALAAQGGK